ncbi:MAG: GNAT family N-acetyltransferase [Euzebyales bacterium]|nr:GNAT family N-acetyltransferase [Euzebyales bacterium]
MADWPPAPLDWPGSALTDGVVALGAMTEADVPAITEACNDPDIALWLPVPVPYTEDDARAFLDHIAAEAAAGRFLNFAVRAAGSGSEGGASHRHHRDCENRSAGSAIRVSEELVGSMGVRFLRAGETEIGYWTAPWGRRRGYASRAVRLLAAHVFATWPVRRAELLVDPDNQASAGVAAGAGARAEGLRRNGGVRHQTDEPRDSLVFSLIPHDLEA